MGKRKDHHKQIIQEALPHLEVNGHEVTQFHTAQKMPRKLRGVPDLHILYAGVSWWIEIKPRYANYMRDQMSDLQFTWFHNRVADFGEYNRYAIVEDEDELLAFVLHGNFQDTIRLGEYHQGRYDQWRRGR